MPAKGQTWRDVARPVIHKILMETAGCDETLIKKALYDAYPFGLRERHPYKIWLDEIRVQRKFKRFGRQFLPDPKQQKLF